jgi:Family of unknown function (DUF6220)
MQIARTVFAGLAWLFVALIVLQVFWAGMGLFRATDMSLHRDFGYTISLVPVLMTLAAAVGRAGRLTLLSAGLLVLAFVQTSLPLARDDVPVLAALHPVNALLLFWLALTIARRATALARGPRAEEMPAA